MAKRRHPVSQSYCDDCSVAFQVYTTDTRPKLYCPLCGDSIAVHKYEGVRYNEIITRIHWKPEELAYLPRIKSRELAAYQVGIMIGRSTNSVVKKYNRWAKLLKE